VHDDFHAWPSRPHDGARRAHCCGNVGILFACLRKTKLTLFAPDAEHVEHVPCNRSRASDGVGAALVYKLTSSYSCRGASSRKFEPENSAKASKPASQANSEAPHSSQADAEAAQGPNEEQQRDSAVQLCTVRRHGRQPHMLAELHRRGMVLHAMRFGQVPEKQRLVLAMSALSCSGCIQHGCQSALADCQLTSLRHAFVLSCASVANTWCHMNTKFELFDT